MPEPVYTYAAVGFVVGVVVGLTLARGLLEMANRHLRQAHRHLEQALANQKHANQLYQSTAREAKAINAKVRRLVSGEHDAT